MSESILKVQNIGKSFGGTEVLRDVSFELERGKFKTIIGPNGAGKTTLFNIISGVMKPTSGSVFFEGTDITGMPTYKLAQMGLGRSFQVTNIFPRSTVIENLRIVAQAKSNAKYQLFRHYTTYKDFLDLADEILVQVKLEGKGDRLAKDLTHAEQRKLEIGMQLALNSKLILFDEPTAGVSAEECPALIEVIRNIKRTGEHSILLIEHKIGMIMDISDTIAVLHNGVLIADDEPEIIRKNKAVQDAYLGGGAIE
ncbi:MAG: ABC transporter ATP-binding protein [Lachnospiraceae bacterium]|nr:ABC transporter ATP-binding protein [Lachnospiraceae bacterium]